MQLLLKELHSCFNRFKALIPHETIIKQLHDAIIMRVVESTTKALDLIVYRELCKSQDH